MAEQYELVIPTYLRSNEMFLQDLGRFVRAPVELKETLYNNIRPVPPYGGLSDAELEEISESFDYSYEELQRIIYLFNLIKQRLLEVHQTPERALSEITNLLGKESTEEHYQEIVTAFSYTDEERSEYFALQALYGGPAYLSSSLRPSLITTVDGSELVGVHFMTLSYLNTDGDQRSVTIGFTPGELEELESAIGDAKHRLETIKARYVEGNEERQS